jgi:DNA-directed RNA polymerase specialized sigma24 family protein
MLLNQMELRFRSQRSSNELHEAFERWRSEHPALAPYGGIEDIWKLFRDRGATYDKKNPIAIALCQLVQDRDELAIVVLVELYAPSLRNAVGRSVGKSPLTVDELHAEAVDGLLTAARGVTLETKRVSALLAGRVRDRLSDAVKSANKAQRFQAPVALERLDPLVERGARSHQSAEDEMLEAAAPRELLERAVRAGVITDDDARLIEDARVEGVSLKDLAERRQESYGATKTRLSRAQKVLRGWLAVRKPPPRQDSGPGM